MPVYKKVTQKAQCGTFRKKPGSMLERARQLKKRMDWNFKRWAYEWVLTEEEPRKVH